MAEPMESPQDTGSLKPMESPGPLGSQEPPDPQTPRSPWERSSPWSRREKMHHKRGRTTEVKDKLESGEGGEKNR